MAKEKAKHDGLLCFLLALIVVLIVIIGGGIYIFSLAEKEEPITGDIAPDSYKQNVENIVLEGQYLKFDIKIKDGENPDVMKVKDIKNISDASIMYCGIQDNGFGIEEECQYSEEEIKMLKENDELKLNVKIKFDENSYQYLKNKFDINYNKYIDRYRELYNELHGEGDDEKIIKWIKKEADIENLTLRIGIMAYNDNNEEMAFMVIINEKELENYKGNNEVTPKPENVEKPNSPEPSKEIKASLTPSGFAGSSLIKVVLYSDKSVYVVNYDGAGYEESNIASKTLIAKNADKIEYNGQGENFKSIIIQGNNVEIINKSYNWIEFNSGNKTEEKAENKTDNKYIQITKEFEGLDCLYITDIIDNKNDTYTLKGVKYTQYVENNQKIKDALKKGTYTVNDIEYKIQQKADDNTRYELINDNGKHFYELVQINGNQSMLVVTYTELFTDCRKLTNEYFEITLPAKTVYRPRDSALAADPELVELETVRDLYNSFDKNAPIDTTHPGNVYGFKFENNKCVEIYYIPTGL